MPNNYALGNIANPNGCVVPYQNGATNYALIVFANNLGDSGTTLIAEIPLSTAYSGLRGNATRY
jgi:hypothetical protein